MQILIGFALAISVGLLGMSIYIRLHPPEGSVEGTRYLQRGLRLGTASAITVSLLFVAMHLFPPISLSTIQPLALVAVTGNIVNAIAVVCCLRELSGESLCATFLILLNQALWILYGLLALTVQF
jgi:hypothetical protein